MALELRDYLLTDAGVAIPGWTVNLRTGRKTGAAGSVLFSTTTSADGMWEFVDGSGGVTLVAGTKYDVQATNGTSERWWRGYTAIPQSFTDLQIASDAGIVLTKLDEGVIDDTVDPATAVTTLQGRLSQFAALLKRLGGGSTFSAPQTSVPNALVNGDFSVWQRGTSFATPANNSYHADRWQWGFSGSGVVTITRDTGVPTVGTNTINTPYACKIDVTTADASIAAGDVYLIYTSIEGFDYRALTHGFTLSFWVKAAKTGTHCVVFQNRGGDRSWIAEYTIAVADTWEYKTLVVTAPPTGGTWDYSTGLGLYVQFVLAAGSNFQSTAGSWLSSGALATSSQVNELDNTANNFYLALVNLVPGSVAVPLVPLPYAVQVERCRRYCQVYGGDATNQFVASGMATNATNANLFMPLVTEMVAVPALTVSSVSDWLLVSSSNAACTGLALTASGAGKRGVGLTVTVASGQTGGQAVLLSANSTTNARLTFEANPV